MVFIYGCNSDLPEPESYGARVYAKRCGQCHRLYSPRSLTGDMWEVQMKVMEDKIQQAGLPPLTEEERKAILQYLKRYAAK